MPLGTYPQKFQAGVTSLVTHAANELVDNSAFTVLTATDAQALFGQIDVLLAGEPPLTGYSYVIPKVTNNNTTNGTNLLAAYTTAKGLTPGGNAIGSTNQVILLLLPGVYDLGTGQLALDTAYVNVVGVVDYLGAVLITSNVSTLSKGTITQTADNVAIQNITVRNSNTTVTPVPDATDPAAYWATTNLPGTSIKNCKFLADDTHVWTMRLAVNYSGTYTDVIAGKWAFGGSTSGVASGTFTRCQGGIGAFGGAGGTMSGLIDSCTGAAFTDTNPWLSIFTGRAKNIKFNPSGSNKDAVQVVHTSTGIFDTCTFIATGTGACFNASDTTATPNLKLYGHNMANAVPNATYITGFAAFSALTVDTNVT
jgi:hypothetical protein